MEELKEIITPATPKKIVWLMLIELWMQRQSLRHTANNAWAISSEDALWIAIENNKDQSDYLLSLL
jgi:hypothetical protein